MSELEVNIVLKALDYASKDIEFLNERINELRERLNTNEFKAAAENFNRIGEAVKNLTQPMADAAKQSLAFAAAITTVTSAFSSQVYQAAVSYESALSDLSKVLEGGRAEAEQYGQQLDEMADKYAQNGQALLSAMSNFVQAGYDAKESFELVDSGIQLMIAGDITAAEASKQLISVLKGFAVPASDAAHAVDLLNEVSNKYATNVAELVIGMAKIAPVARNMGFTMDEAAGLLTPIIEVYQSGAEAADALKVSLLKLTDDAKPVQKALEDIGVAQKDLSENLRSGKDIFLDVAQAFQSLSDVERLDLTAKLVGLEQAGRFSTALGNISGVMGVTEVSSKSFGSAISEVSNKLKTSQTEIDRANERFRQLSVTLGNQFRTEITGVVAATGELAKAFNEASQGGALQPLFDALKPQIQSIETLFTSLSKNLEEALSGLDWTPLVDALRSISGEFSEAFSALFGGIDLTTVAGLRDLLQGLIQVLANFTQYISGVVDGMGPLMSSFNLLFQYFSLNRQETVYLIGNVHGLMLSFNEIVPAVSSFAASIFNAIGQVTAFIGVITLLVSAFRLLNGVGALGVLTSLPGVLGNLIRLFGSLSVSMATWIAVFAGVPGLVATLGAAVLVGSAALGVYLSKLLESEDASDLAAVSSQKLADKLKQIGAETGVTVASMKQLEEAVKSGALVFDEVTGSWSKGNEELKKREATTQSLAEANQLLIDKARAEADAVNALTEYYRSAGLEYDARTGAVKKAAEASADFTDSLTWEEQLLIRGVDVFRTYYGYLYRVSLGSLEAADSQSKLSAAIQKAAVTDAAAYAQKLSTIRAHQAELINLADSEAARRRSLAESLGEDLTHVEELIANEKKRVLSQSLKEYQAYSDSLKAAARSYLEESKRIEEEIANLKASTEDRLRSLRQQGMSDYEKYQDQQKQIAEKGEAARSAILAGEFTKAAELYDEQAKLAESAARKVVDGDKEVVSQQKAVQTAVEQVSGAMQGKEQALQAMSDSNKARADAANAALNQTEAAASDASEQIASLSKEDTVSKHTVETNVDEVLDEIAKLEQDTESTHTIHKKVIEESATGGLIGVGRYAVGGQVPRFRPQNWSTVPGVGDTDSVPAALDVGSFVLRKRAVKYYGHSLLDLISRFARGGRVAALLTPGERLFNPSTVTRLGVNFFDDLNHMRLPRDEIMAALNRAAEPVARFASGGSVSALSTSGSSYSGARDVVDVNLRIGDQQVVRLQGARAQVQALTSALRTLQRTP